MKTWKSVRRGHRPMAAALALRLCAGHGELLPNLSYRTGPFAATGIPLMNGQADYMTCSTSATAASTASSSTIEECETGYNTEKGVECYEKTKATALVTQPWSTGITLQVLPKSNVDKIRSCARLRLLGDAGRQDLPMGLQPAGLLLGRRVDDPARRFPTAISTT
jgi:hypothetical protein